MPTVATGAIFLSEIEGEGIEDFAYIDGTILGLTGATAGTVRALPFLRHEFDGIGIAVSPAKTVAPSPNGYAAFDGGTDIALGRGVYVRIANKGGVVGVLVVYETYAVECAVGIVGDGGADYLAHCLAGTPDKQATTFIVTESLGERTRLLERVMDTAARTNCGAH